jgi:hypothetical protein
MKNSRDDHAGSRSGVRSLQQADEERPARWPPSLRLKIAKDPRGIVATFFGDSQKTNDNGDQTSDRPEDGESLCVRRKK